MTIKTLKQTQSSSQFSPTSENQLALQHHARSDFNIIADVQRVLQEDTILSATADRIDPRVNADVVTLRGYVASDVHKARAADDVRQVPGVRQVENYLIADPDLEALVGQKIAQDARLRGYSIFGSTPLNRGGTLTT